MQPALMRFLAEHSETELLNHYTQQIVHHTQRQRTWLQQLQQRQQVLLQHIPHSCERLFAQAQRLEAGELQRIMLLQAAELGHVSAQYTLAQDYYVQPDQQQAAVYWYSRAADQNHADAQYQLGLCYSNGLGVTADLASAMSHYYQAATQGNIAAQYALGESLTSYPVEALKWYQQAANQGHAESMYHLGELYYQGKEGITQNRTQAVQWFKKAAKQSSANGQAWLGRCYYEGVGGLNQDHTQAKEWFKKAAKQHPGARIALDLIDQLSMVETREKFAEVFKLLAIKNISPANNTPIQESSKLRNKILLWEGF